MTALRMDWLYFVLMGLKILSVKKVNKNFLQFNGLETIEQAVGQSCDAIFQNASPQIMTFLKKPYNRLSRNLKL